MLDDSMFEEIHEIAENSAYLKMVEERGVSLEMLEKLPPYEECHELEEKLRKQQLLNFDNIFLQPTGYYMIKCFLVADYAVDKAIFIKDVQAYQNLRFPSARRKIAKLIYQRFVSQDPEDTNNAEFKKSSSVFEILQQRQHRQRNSGQHQFIETKSHFHTDSHAERTMSSGSMKNTLNASSYSHRPQQSESEVSNNNSILQIGTCNNSIGVYGQSVQRVREKIEKDLQPEDLFDEVALEVTTDLKSDVFPRFMTSEFYKNFIRTKMIETQHVKLSNFTILRALGRGGFGTVHACRKKDSGAIYAMKCLKMKLVKTKSAVDNVLEERNVLTIIKSTFVTNLKYALSDEDTLYLIMDLMLGGDLKYHLINEGHFSEKQARFFAAEILLGLEAMHKASIIYRDLKLENVLLDDKGHCRLSDLGLAVVTKVKIKGYAGTPGYTAPEMIKNKLYGPAVDFFSYGVLLYRMRSGQKPFKGKVDRDLDRAVIEKKPQFPKEIFSPSAISLLSGLLRKRPDSRTGCGKTGTDEIKEHPFFECIDWGLLEAGYVDPPFIPDKLNFASIKDIGDFHMAKYRHVKLDDSFKRKFENFDYMSVKAVQEEMVEVLKKSDENKTFEKFASQNSENIPIKSSKKGQHCCTIL